MSIDEDFDFQEDVETIDVSPEVLPVFQHLLGRKNKERQNRKFFDALIAAPAVGSFSMPANARLVLRSVAGAVEGTPAVTITGPSAINIISKELSIGEIQFIGYIGRASTVDPQAGFEILVDNGLGVYLKIAEGV